MIDDDVEPEVFDGWIEVLLNARVESMDLVDEKDVLVLEIRQDASQITCALDLGAAGGLQARSDGGGDEIGQSRFAQTGRTAEQHVIERLGADLGGLDHHEQLLFHLRLAMEVGKISRP